MGDLERLFLGTMMVTGLLILGLFGLYFDLGDMVAGSFGRGGPTFSQDLDLIRERRRASYGQQKKPLMTSGGLGGPGPSRPSSEPDYGRLIIRRPQPSRGELIDREIRRLQRRGYVDEEYLRMRAVYQVDRSLVKVFDLYDRMIAEGDFQGAIEALQEALEDLDEDNHYGRRDVMRYLYQAHIQAGQDGNAAEMMRKMTEVTDYVVSVEDRAEAHKDNAGQEYVRKMRENMSKVRESLDAANDHPGPRELLRRALRPTDGSQGKIEVPVQGVEQSLRAQMLQQGMDPEQIKKQLSVLKTITVQDVVEAVEARGEAP